MAITVKGGSSGNYAEVTADGKLLVSAGSHNAYGALSVSPDGTTLFYDAFEGAVVDTVNRWTLYGTVAPTQTQGNVNLSPTGANATCVMSSQPPILINTAVTVAGLITFETAPTTGNHRFWGLGTVTGNVGTAAVPLTDAVGFEVDTLGVLRASVYRAGTRVYTTPLTMPTDGLPHVFLVFVRGDIAFFHLDDQQVPVGFTSIGPASQVLPMRMHSLNGAAVTGTPTFIVNGFAVIDDFRLATGISDGTFPWRKARVDAYGALTTVQRSTELCISATAASGIGVTATLPAAGTGLYHYITRIAIFKYAAVALSAVATPSVVTTTNLPGSLAFSFTTLLAQGVGIDRDEIFTSPLKSTAANTNTTVVAPTITNAIWRVNVYYFTGT